MPIILSEPLPDATSGTICKRFASFVSLRGLLGPKAGRLHLIDCKLAGPVAASGVGSVPAAHVQATEEASLADGLVLSKMSLHA